MKLTDKTKSNNQTKSIGRGGKRQGAGRKPGSATKRTRAIADKAAEQGVTPLEVMLDSMKAYTDQAKKSKDPAMKLKLMAEAASVAKDAAPYMHPRLQAIEHTGGDGGPIDHSLTVEFVATK